MCSGSPRGGCTCACRSCTRRGLQEAQEAVFATSAEWRWSCESGLDVALDQLTYAVVLALDVFQIVALLALAEVAAEGVHALPVVRAEVLPSNAFVNI